MTRLRRDYIQRLELRRFSESTISSYVSVVAKVAQFHGCSPLSLTTRHLRDFLYDELKVKKLSAATMNQHIGSLKSFYRMPAPDSEVMKGISAMKVPQKLPVVLTREETSALLGAVSNIKHRAILEFMYSSGIRLAECIELVPAPRAAPGVRAYTPAGLRGQQGPHGEDLPVALISSSSMCSGRGARVTTNDEG